MQHKSRKSKTKKQVQIASKQQKQGYAKCSNDDNPAITTYMVGKDVILLCDSCTSKQQESKEVNNQAKFVSIQSALKQADQNANNLINIIQNSLQSHKNQKQYKQSPANLFKIIFDKKTKTIKNAYSKCQELVKQYFEKQLQLIKMEKDQLINQYPDIKGDKTENLLTKKLQKAKKISKDISSREPAKAIKHFYFQNMDEEQKYIEGIVKNAKFTNKYNLDIFRQSLISTEVLCEPELLNGLKRDLKLYCRFDKVNLENQNLEKLWRKQIAQNRELAEVISSESQLNEKGVQHQDKETQGIVMNIHRTTQYQNVKSFFKKDKLKNLRQSVKYQPQFDPFAKIQTTNDKIHYFNIQTSVLHLMSLSNNSVQDKKIKLNLDFDLPMFHKSVSTTSGEIYLTGGAFQKHQSETIYSNAIYQVDQENATLVRKTNMKQNRICHAICYLKDYIYVIGGIGIDITGNQYQRQMRQKKSSKEQQKQKLEPLAHCERYSILRDEWEDLPLLKYPSYGCSACSFQDRYIYKFGGKQGKKRLVNTIERYDTEFPPHSSKIFTQIKFELNNTSFIDKPRLNCCIGALQISRNQFFLFGGQTTDLQDKTDNYILTVQKDQENEYSGIHYLSNINKFYLPCSGKILTSPVGFNKRIFAISVSEKDSGRKPMKYSLMTISGNKNFGNQGTKVETYE